MLAETEKHRFAFRSEDVDSIFLLPRLTQRPGDIPLIEGWLKLRGDSLPVISLARVLGMDPEPPLLSDRLILTVTDPRVAWRVRHVGGLRDLSWEDLRLLEHSAEPTPCYVAAFEHDGHDVQLLNVSGLLMVEEQERLRQAEEKRLRRLGELEEAPIQEPQRKRGKDRAAKASSHGKL